MRTLTDEQAQLFLDKNYAVVTTLRTDGSPQMSLVPPGEQRVIVRVRPERVTAYGFGA